LTAARAGGQVVRLRRRGPLHDLDGYVLDVGRTLVLVAWVADGIWLDGWTVVRLRDVRRVALLSNGPFIDAALRLRGQWPPRPPEEVLDLGSRRGLLLSLARERLLAVHREHRRPGTCVIGVLRAVGGGELQMVEVTPKAQWEVRRRSRRLRHVTRVDIGGSYEAALLSVAGPAPSPHLV